VAAISRTTTTQVRVAIVVGEEYAGEMSEQIAAHPLAAEV
jgi:hypothetical protein